MRGGRKSQKRAAGGIEPFHTLGVSLDDRGGDLVTLRESRFSKVRSALTGNLDAMDAAGTFLRWARHLLPYRHKAPRSWDTALSLLDALDEVPVTPLSARGLLALAGLTLLAAEGYALELDRCVVCGRACPAGATAFVQPARGGLVSRDCGAGGVRLRGNVRALAAAAQRAHLGGGARELPPWVTSADVAAVLAVVTGAMAAHAGMDSAAGA
jgi:DNA repair protein RecO (recombination protein O)